MADTILHITIARQIAHHPTLPPQITKIVNAHFDDFLMGSVVFDLPYYDNLLMSGIRILQKKPIVYHPFGQTLHETYAKRLCIALLSKAQNDAQLSMAFGALCHFSVDILFHREIEHLVVKMNRCHDDIEREMGLHCHYDSLGHSGIGTPYTQNATLLFPTPNWAEYICHTMGTVHPNTPSESTFLSWQRSFRVFGLLYSRRWFPWLTTVPKNDDNLAFISLELMNQSIQQTIEFLHVAHQYVQNKIVVEELSQALPSLRMADGLPE